MSTDRQVPYGRTALALLMRQSFINTLILVLVATLSLCLSSGCGPKLSPEEIAEARKSYIAATFDPSVLDLSQEPGAERVKLSIPLVTRRYEQRYLFSRGHLTYWPTEDFEEEITSALRQGFGNMGFHMVDSNPDVTLSVEVENVRASSERDRVFLPGIRYTGVAQVAVRVVDGSTETILWEQTIIVGPSKERYRGEEQNIQKQLEAAFTELFAEVFSNENLKQALLHRN